MLCIKSGQMIIVRNVSVVQLGERPDNVILENINLNIEPGDYLSVCGPEGSGKTSLLLLLGLFDRPSSGELIFNNVNVSKLSNSKLELMRRNNVGYVGNKYSLLDSYSVGENVELPLVYRNQRSGMRKSMVKHTLDIFNVGHLVNRKVTTISMLEVQLVTLARAIVARPEIIIADEPTGMLNSHHTDDFMNALDAVCDSGISIVHGTSSGTLADKAVRRVNLFDGHLIV